MNNVGVIDTFLNTFKTYIDSGFGLVRSDVACVCRKSPPCYSNNDGGDCCRNRRAQGRT